MTSVSKEAFLAQLMQNANGSPEALRDYFEQALDKLGWAEKTIFGPEELAMIGIAMAHRATAALSDAADPTAQRTGRTLEALLSQAEAVLGPALHRTQRQDSDAPPH